MPELGIIVLSSFCLPMELYIMLVINSESDKVALGENICGKSIFYGQFGCVRVKLQEARE